MDTRLIQTKIWEDDWFQSLSEDGQRFFLFILTNNKIGFTGIFQLSEFFIQNYAKIKGDKLVRLKIELADRVAFYKDWVYVKNSEKHNPFKGKHLEAAKKKEFDKIPDDVREYFIKGKNVYPIDTPSIPHEQGINTSTIARANTITNNSSNIATYFKNIPTEDLEEFTNNFNANKQQVKDKGEDLWYWFNGLSPSRKRSYADGKGILRNAIKKDFGKRPTPKNVVIKKDEKDWMQSVVDANKDIYDGNTININEIEK